MCAYIFDEKRNSRSYSQAQGRESDKLFEEIAVAEEEQQKKEDAAPTEKKGMDLGKILGLVFALLNLGVMGTGAFVVYSNTLGYEKPKVFEDQMNVELQEFTKKIQQHPVIYSMEPLLTNLNGLPRRNVRLEVNLEMLDEEGFEEVLGVEATARDSVVRILNSKEFDELETVQGKLLLKNQIITQVNGFLKKGVVKNVYFTKFAVQ